MKTSARFYDSNSRAAHVADLTEVVSASSEVLAVTWPSEDSDTSPGLADARHAYFKVLLERCEKHHLRYTRVLQMADCHTASVASVIATSFDQLYIEHFRQMLDAKACREQGLVQLKVMPLTVPGTFVLVDRSYFAWEICEVKSALTPMSWQSQYSMQIEDSPGGGFAALAGMFESFYASSARDVEWSDLPARP